MAETKIVVMRHGRTVGNQLGYLNQTPCEGLLHEAIPDIQASATAAGSVDILFTSYMRRAMQTAHVVGEVQGLKPEILPGIQERHLGLLEGMHKDKALEIVDEADIIEGAAGVRYVNGTYGSESFRELKARTAKALRVVRRRLLVSTRALLVTHGDAALALCAAATGVPMDEVVKKMHFGNAEFATIDDDGNVTKGGEQVLESRLAP